MKQCKRYSLNCKKNFLIVYPKKKIMAYFSSISLSLIRKQQISLRGKLINYKFFYFIFRLIDEDLVKKKEVAAKPLKKTNRAKNETTAKSIKDREIKSKATENLLKKKRNRNRNSSSKK